METTIINADVLTDWAQIAIVNICNRMGWTASSVDGERIEIQYPKADADIIDFIFADL